MSMNAPATTIYDVVSRCMVVDLNGKTIMLGPFDDRRQAVQAAKDYISRKTPHNPNRAPQT